ncbi:MAG TPA: hypothetical protein VNT53_03870, partial [Pseudolysinimonas sp.]|nr:hypothetical protein [Pseudolysinimonas sp.]
KLSFSAPSADAQGEVEVRNQRGQLEQAATAVAQRQQAEQAAALSRDGGSPAPAAAPASGSGGRGAFGQRTEDGGQAPQNRAQRRAQGKR